MDDNKAAAIAHEYFNKYMKPEWGFKDDQRCWFDIEDLDRLEHPSSMAVTRRGTNWLGKKECEIVISRHCIRCSAEEDVRVILLHEIAHALLPEGEGHGPIWGAVFGLLKSQEGLQDVVHDKRWVSNFIDRYYTTYPDAVYKTLEESEAWREQVRREGNLTPLF